MSDIDPEDIEEAAAEILVGAREWMIADHIVRVTTQEELTQFIANTLAVLNRTADLIGTYSVVLRAIPDVGVHLAESLAETALMLRPHGLEESDDDA